MPTSLSEFPAAPTHLPSKADAVLGTDDVLVFHPPGGGGYGDPLDRDPERVAADVAYGRVSRESARLRYGVVLRDDNQVDLDATIALRARMRAQRLEGCSIAPVWSEKAARPAVRAYHRPRPPRLQRGGGQTSRAPVGGRAMARHAMGRQQPQLRDRGDYLSRLRRPVRCAGAQEVGLRQAPQRPGPVLFAVRAPDLVPPSVVGALPF